MVDSRVFAIKTHYPEKLGHCPFRFLFKNTAIFFFFFINMPITIVNVNYNRASRAILLVRNPLDSIVSYFHMCLTRSHNSSLEETEFKKYVCILRTIDILIFKLLSFFLYKCIYFLICFLGRYLGSFCQRRN